MTRILKISGFVLRWMESKTALLPCTIWWQNKLFYFDHTGKKAHFDNFYILLLQNKLWKILKTTDKLSSIAPRS